MHTSDRSFRPSLAVALYLLGGLALTGCVQRRMTIVSDPPGALVYVDNYEIGTTPVSVDFVYYGTRQFRLVRDGYETLTVERRISPPWYQYFPLDFVSENVVPVELRDERTLRFQLIPQVVVPTQQLLSRAEELRRTANTTATGVGPAAAREGAPVYPLPAPGSEARWAPQGLPPTPANGLPSAPGIGPTSGSSGAGWPGGSQTPQPPTWPAAGQVPTMIAPSNAAAGYRQP